MFHLERILPIFQTNFHDHKFAFVNNPTTNLIVMIINNNYRIEFIL
jgi:hypothetical protein